MTVIASFIYLKSPNLHIFSIVANLMIVAKNQSAKIWSKRHFVHYRDIFVGNSIKKKNFADKTTGIEAGEENVLIDPEAAELGTRKICPGATCQLFKGKFSTSTGKVGGGM